MSARNTFISFFGLGSHSAAPLLYSHIKEHPEAVLSATTTNFFADTKIFARGIDWYESNFKSKLNGVAGELAEKYLQTAQSAGLIARAYPDAKLLAVVENPLISIKVEYLEALRQGSITRRVSLFEFLKRYPDTLLKAKYGQQLEHYFAYYSPTDLLVVLASEVRQNPLGTLKRVFAHIGLDSNYVPMTLRHLIVEEVDEKKKPGFIKRLFPSLKTRFRKLYKHLKPPEVATETATERAQKLVLPEALEKKLKDYYRSDVVLLSNLLHRDLAVEWGFGDK